MVRAFLKWLGEWLLATLFVFLTFIAVMIIFLLSMMFLTWSVPEFMDIGKVLDFARALLLCSAFIGFCRTVSPDWDDEW
ncbi:cell division protein FtsK [Escherichia coli]|nr:cell division protein FtsK [Escherichia coli]